MRLDEVKRSFSGVVARNLPVHFPPHHRRWRRPTGIVGFDFLATPSGPEADCPVLWD